VLLPQTDSSRGVDATGVDPLAGNLSVDELWPVKAGELPLRSSPPPPPAPMSHQAAAAWLYLNLQPMVAQGATKSSLRRGRERGAPQVSTPTAMSEREKEREEREKMRGKKISHCHVSSM